MGTHPNGPSHLFSSPSTSVLDVIKSNPAHYLGPTLLQKWPSTTHVPFLFKILSIGKALPLQAHPDKSLGEELNRENPREFVDANHKPEIAVAVGEPLGNGNGGGWGEGVVFTGFVGFKPLQEIRDLVQNLPELQRAIGDERLAKAFLDNPTKAALNAIFSSLINRGANSPDLVKKEVLALIGRLEAGPRDILGTGVQATELAKLLVKINAQYPGDVGVFATSFFMNFVKLQKGESVYIGADEIHAYLEGGAYMLCQFRRSLLTTEWQTSLSVWQYRTTCSMGLSSPKLKQNNTSQRSSRCSHTLPHHLTTGLFLLTSMASRRPGRREYMRPLWRSSLC